MIKSIFKDKQALKLMILGVIFIACLITFHFISLPQPVIISVYGVLYLLSGYECIIGAFKRILKKPFNEKFLMVVASVGSFILGCYEEAVAVMLLYSLGEFFEDLAQERSENSITALMDAIPKTARVLDGEDTVETKVEDVRVGDILVVKPENGDIEQYLIPFVADLVPVVDINHKRVIVKPIEGLFDEV